MRAAVRKGLLLGARPDEVALVQGAYGITGVPTFVAGRYGVVGAQPYEVLEQSCGRPHRQGMARTRG
jgi:hypothetical protein